MCDNPTNSISVFQLALPLIYITTSVLNIWFLVRHWQYFDDHDEEILRTIILFLLVTGYAMSAFIAIVFSHNLINPPTIRIVFVVMSVLGLVKVYAFLYRKCEVFGPRLRTTEYKLAVVNYSIQLFTFLFNYSMQYIIYIPMYKLAGQNITLDTVTIFISTFVVAVAGVMILLKGISLSCFEEDDDHWFKRMFFFGECCCDLFEAQSARKYHEAEDEEASWATDYSWF